MKRYESWTKQQPAAGAVLLSLQLKLKSTNRRHGRATGIAAGLSIVLQPAVLDDFPEHESI